LKKILVVDDEIDVISLFQQTFRKEIKNSEMDLSFAHSAEEALQFLDIHQHEAILILSDINMPGKSGLDLLREVKQKAPQPPPVVILITAYGDSETYNVAKSLGSDEFLTKPIDFVALKSLLLQ
jgi:two-component system, chemotaxis family, chemotaxis protein CheY